jgi:hypothetical protein
MPNERPAATKTGSVDCGKLKDGSDFHGWNLAPRP